MRFCPTGASPGDGPGYLALPNVGCAGGIWLSPAGALSSGDYAHIEKLAAEAAALG